MFFFLFFLFFLLFLVKTKSNPTVSLQLELVGVVSWTWVGLGFDNNPLIRGSWVVINS